MRVSCTNCGAGNDITIYPGINVASDPELKAKVKDGSLFVWKCPDCGQLNLNPYQTLYHDPAAKIMVWLFPEETVSEEDRIVAENRMALISKQLQEGKQLEGYTLRRLSGLPASWLLRGKIMWFRTVTLCTSFSTYNSHFLSLIKGLS